MPQLKNEEGFPPLPNASLLRHSDPDNSNGAVDSLVEYIAKDLGESSEK